MRGDIADVRLADRVFAPHYAAPLHRTVTTAAPLRTSRDSGSAVLAMLDVGTPFELLDVTGGTAWGVAPDSGFVGYLDATLLGPVA